MNKRKFLTHSEVMSLLQEARKGTNSIRNYCMVLMCYFHGLRVSELISLRISDIDIDNKKIFIPRLKNGFSTVHPLQKSELKAIQEWLSEREKHYVSSDFLFTSSKRGKITRQLFHHIIKKLGTNAGLSLSVHPHMLRHACGYALADKGKDTRLIQDYLGHRSIHHTVLYTASNSARFSSIKF
ncbi:tyrosine-type recombinase/integrase [Citrobacter amalonaticus]|nr:tyrosine-type recombinase/integrase [Citrobacter amalonaticus]